jgi:hypothetical protein
MDSGIQDAASPQREARAEWTLDWVGVEAPDSETGAVGTRKLM